MHRKVTLGKDGLKSTKIDKDTLLKEPGVGAVSY